MSSEDELFQAWREGDTVAGQQFARAMFPRIRRFMASKCGAEVEELVQRTLVRLVEAKDRYQGQSSPRAFVFGVARNVLREHYRANHGPERGDVEEQSVRDLGAGPSTMRWRRLEDERLLDVLRQLPLHMQTVLELFYWDDLTGREIAEVLEVAEGTVASRLRRAKLLLNALYEGKEPPREPAPTDADDGGSLDAWAERVREAVQRSS